MNCMFAPNNGPGAELYDFDPQTGIVFHVRIADSMGSFAAASSPDNSRLYAQERCFFIVLMFLVKSG